MTRPKHPNYDTAYEKLEAALKAALADCQSGTIGHVSDRLFDAIIALDDCFAHDGQECRFTRARPIIEAWKP
jgi:hypothetical protein